MKRLIGISLWLGTMVVSGQTINETSIYSDPAGATITVDGQAYYGSAAFLWPAGSKHTLTIQQVQEPRFIAATKMVFQSWDDSSGQFTSSANTIVITADPALTYFKAKVPELFALSLNSFNSCGAPDPRTCPGWPGQILINGVPYFVSQDVYLEAGTLVTLQANPAPGWVFTGWSPGLASGTQAFLTSFTLTNPIQLFPIFTPAQHITIVTSPPGFQILADRTILRSPTSLEWGVGTVHTLGVVEPQVDGYGNTWVFASWSDGGASTHTYTMPQGSVTVTAAFVPGGRASFFTDPPGLKLLIDGRDNWPSYNFSWSAGSAHTITAPDTQVDLGGTRKYTFQSWSNGGPATQNFVFTTAMAASGIRLTASYTSFGIIIVDSTPQGVLMAVDGVDCATPCNLQRPLGAIVHVVAPAAVGLAVDTRLNFAGWLDSPLAARTLTFTAAPQLLRAPYSYSYLLTLTASPAKSGVFQMTPPSADGFYPAGATVQIMTTALDGFKFKTWGGDATGYYRPFWIDMTVPRVVLALFGSVPFVADGGIVNAAGQTPLKSVAPGSIASIYGANLAPSVAAGPGSPLPRTLNGVVVTSGGKTLPLLFVSPEQINVQVPSDAVAGNQTLTVSWNGQ